MLKIFDKEHNAIGHIVKYKDLKIEGDVSTGDKLLSFTYLANRKLCVEYYIQTKTDEYVIREESLSKDGFPQYVATLNLEELEGKAWQSFSVADSTIDDAARAAMAGTGWTVGTCGITKRRNAGMVYVSSKEAVLKLCTAFMCEPVWDTVHKTVSFYEETGEDKGTYFINGLNLKKLDKKSDSYDYYTQIMPVGEDGLLIGDVNDGKNYLENYQYSHKVKVYIWKDESYTDAQALKEDAEKKLADMSKPVVSYACDVRDLAKQKPGYGILSYGLGDKVWLIDRGTGTREQQRIMKLTEYPQDPDKNTCELANAVLTFEELQQKYQEAAEIVGAVISDDGKIKLSDILHWEDGIAGSQAVSDMRSIMASMQGDLALTRLTVGNLETNMLRADEAELKYAAIGSLQATEARIDTLSGEYASFESMVTSELTSLTARIEKIVSTDITVEYLEANYAAIDMANVVHGSIQSYHIGDGQIGSAQIADASITDAKIVELTANKINAGTLSVERLEIRGSTNSLVYALNDITGALQAQNVDTLNGEVLTPRTVTADRLVARSITAEEIASQTITANEINVANLFAQDIEASGTIRGLHIVGATGDFFGTVNATDGVFRGTVYATAGEFTGKVTATSGSFTGTVDATDGVFRGIVYATAGEFTGKIKGEEIDIRASKDTPYGPWEAVLTADSADGICLAYDQANYGGAITMDKGVTTIEDGNRVVITSPQAVEISGFDVSITADNGLYIDGVITGKIADALGGAGITFSYSKAGLNYGDYTYLAAWNGHELRSIHKSQYAVASHTHNYAAASHTHSYLPLSGGTVTGNTTVTGGWFRTAWAYSNTSSRAANVQINDSGTLRRSASSSKRYKHNIRPLADSLDAEKLLSVPVVQYIYNPDYLSGEDPRYGKSIPGFIAEDIAEYYPIAAEVDAEGCVEDWNIRMIVPPMLALVQEEYWILGEHGSRLSIAEARQDSAEARLSFLQSQLMSAMAQLASQEAEIQMLKAKVQWLQTA